MIKTLKAICCILGFIFFLALIATLLMFSCGTIKEFFTAFGICSAFSVLFLCCALVHWILCDHEENMKPDFREYLEDLAREQN